MLGNIFNEIKSNQNISNESLDNAIGEVLFSFKRELSSDVNIIETTNSMIMKSGSVFPTCKEGYLSRNEVDALMERLLEG